MQAIEFLNLADSLVGGSKEAEWRSAVSRAYYAVFHTARDLFQKSGFEVPRGESAHGYFWLRLSNCGSAEIKRAGEDFNSLRRDRNRADYDIDRPLNRNTASSQVEDAKEILRLLGIASKEPTKSQITEAMKNYERDVLKEVTWQP